MKFRLKGVALIGLLLLCAERWLLPAHSQEQSSDPVKLSLIVTNDSNHSVDDVQREQIKVSEEGISQTLTTFSKDTRPVDYGLLIDTSGSLRALLSGSLLMAKLIVHGNRPEDKTFVVRFVSSEKIQTVQDLTADKAKLIKALDSLYVEGGQSAVIDAVYVAAKDVAKQSPDLQARRQALVLITDGEDRASRYTEQELVRLLREKNVQVFVIGIVHHLDMTRSFARKRRESAEKLLTGVAAVTGGRAFFPKNDLEFLQAANQVVHDLNTQYTIGYLPVQSTPRTGFRAVKVSMVDAPEGDRRIAITRPGYLVGNDSDKTKEQKVTKPN